MIWLTYEKNTNIEIWGENAFLCLFYFGIHTKCPLSPLVFPVQVPGPAPNLQAVSTTPTSVTLSWDTPLTGNGDVLTYKVYYMEKGLDLEQVRPSVMGWELDGPIC